MKRLLLKTIRVLLITSSLLFALTVIVVYALTTPQRDAFSYIKEAFDATNKEYGNILRMNKVLFTDGGIETGYSRYNYYFYLNKRGLSDDEFLLQGFEALYSIHSEIRKSNHPQLEEHGFDIFIYKDSQKFVANRGYNVTNVFGDYSVIGTFEGSFGRLALSADLCSELTDEQKEFIRNNYDFEIYMPF